MRSYNYILVYIETLEPSIFYWQDVKSLSKLKESVKKRFQISPSVQKFLFQSQPNNISTLNDEGYNKLYEKRFKEPVNLFLRITDKSFNVNAIQERREENLWKLKTIEIETGRYLGDALFEKLSIQIEDSVLKWTVCDLKNKICQLTNDPIGHAVLISSDDIILADSQLISDVYLDLPNETGKIVFYQNVPIGEATRGHNILSKFNITLPGNVEDLSVDYPLVQIGLFEVSEMKSWIEAFYYIPCTEQRLYFLRDRGFNDTSDYSLVEKEKFDKGDGGQRPIEIKVFVYSALDENLKSIYQKTSVRTIKPIHIKSFTSDSYQIYHFRGDETKQSINSSITKNMQIPMNKQHLFFNNSAFYDNRDGRSDGLEKVVLESHLANDQETSFIDFRLIVQADDEDKKLLKAIKDYKLSRSRSLIVKHPCSDTIFYETSLSTFQSQSITCEEISKLHPQLSNDVICLLHKGKKFEDPADIREFMLQEYVFSENLILTLAIKPSSDEKVAKFCQEHDLKFLKEIKIHFLTGQFTVDITSGGIENVEDLKRVIYETKTVAPHLQVLYKENQNVEIDNKFDLIAANNLMTAESFTFKLVVHDGDELKLTFKCTFMEEPFEAIVREVTTIEEIKAMISEKSGIPISLISFDLAYTLDREKLPVWEYFKTFNKSGSSNIYVTKRVKISVNKDGVVSKDFSPIRNYKTDTLKELYKRMELLNPGCDVSMQENGLAYDTLLNEVGEQEIIFLITSQKKRVTGSTIDNNKCLIS